MMKKLENADGDSLRIDVPEPFSFAENVRYLSRAANECLFQIRDQRLFKAIPLGEKSTVVEIGATDDRELNVRFIGGTTPPRREERAEVARYIREWFDLDTDLRPFYELARSDELLHRAVTGFRGLRIIGIPDLFEAISWGIIGQQINLAFAYTLKKRLVERFGRRVECEGQTYWIFPTPQRIAALTVDDLADLRMTVKKCEYLIDVAGLIAEGKLSKELLREAGTVREAEKRLVAIRGIGPWTAHYVLMRCLRMPSAFPIDDVGLHNAIRFALGMDKKPTKAEIARLASAWTGWESYATFYLWRFLY